VPTDTIVQFMPSSACAVVHPREGLALPGVQLAFIQALTRHWATDYDWRRCEAQLNAHPQGEGRIDRAEVQLASRGRLPDAAFCKKIEEYWAST
jgi:hypothetical protein